MAYSLAGFNGQRPDPVSGHYHLGNGYRAYSPVLGRFTCPDDMSPFGPGGINPYVYCAGDPVNRADPSGHFSLGQGIGMALGFVAGIALSILTEGAAMPVALTLMATVAGDAAIGAGAELATEAIDGQRINWGQAGIAAGMSTAASLVGFGVGKGISKAFRGMKNISSAVNGAAYSAEQVNAWDRVATRGLGRGRLLGGSDVPEPDVAGFLFRGRTYEPHPYEQKLYRGDTRNPDEVFSFGFSSRGNNPSIQDYISYSDRNSVFISFTKNKIKAAEYAVGGKFSAPGSKGYLYKVSHLEQAIDFVGNHIGMAENTEVVSTKFVSPQHIKGAYEIIRNADYSLSFGQYIKNNSFFDKGKPWFKFWA